MWASLLLAVSVFAVSSVGHTVGARVRHAAPSLNVTIVQPDLTFKDIALPVLGKWTLLIFYPLDFTFVCPTEVLAFSDAHNEFRTRDVSVFFASIDSKFSHLAWLRTPRTEGGVGRISIPLVADVTRELSKSYDVLINDDTEDNGVAQRSTFLIDPNGIVRHISHNDLPVGRSVEETLRIIDSFQFVAAHPGQGCPANWKKGQRIIKTDPLGSKEYFSQIKDEI